MKPQVLIGGPALRPDKALVICDGGPGLIIDLVVTDHWPEVRLLVSSSFFYDSWGEMLIL